jgi:hypothetical protein
MSFKNLMGTLSPVYGAMSGEGAMGKLLNPDEAARIAKQEQDRQAAAAEQMNAERQAAAVAAAKSGMKKGGSVKSASQRADGCAIRGKTRA